MAGFRVGDSEQYSLVLKIESDQLCISIAVFRVTGVSTAVFRVTAISIAAFKASVVSKSLFRMTAVSKAVFIVKVNITNVFIVFVIGTFRVTVINTAVYQLCSG